MSSIASVTSDECYEPPTPSRNSQSTRKSRTTGDFMMNDPPACIRSPPSQSTPRPGMKSKQSRAERDRIEQVPPKLACFLRPNLDLKHYAPATRILLQAIILHFDADAPIKDTMTRPTLISMFDIHVKPILLKHPNTTAMHLVASSINNCTHPPPADTASFAHALLPDFDPHHRKSTKDILKLAIEHKKPGFKCPYPISKIDLITLFERIVHRTPKQVSPFTISPRLLTPPELSGQTRDELHFAIRCHRPDIFVRVASSKEVVINVYKRYLLGEPESLDDRAHLGVDFFIRVK